MTKVTELWVYPVKGLAGISLQQAELTPTGLKHDRHWMVVDERGRFITQRQLPQMATVTTEITDDQLILRHPQQPQPLCLPLQQESQGDQAEVKVWDSELPATVVAAAGAWLTAALASPRALRLVRFSPSQQRPIKAKYLHHEEQSHTQFADGFPLLLCNQQTLEQLNSALTARQQAAVPMTRFRGNVVVDQCGGAMAELAPLDLSNQQVRFSTRKPCERCPVTRIDQLSGERMHPKEPLTTLTELNPLVDKPGAYFGGNAVVVSSGMIRVGDQLTVTPSTWQPKDR